MRRRGSTRRRFNKVRFRRKTLITLVVAVLVLVCARSCAEEPVKVEASEAFVTPTPEPTAILVPMARYPVPLDDDLQYFITQSCEEHHILPSIIFAMIDRESDFEAGKIGDDGNSYGLMQIQEKFHQDRIDRLGVTDLLDPYQNVTVGIDYLAELLEDYDGNVEMALVAYNAGPTGANKYWFSAGVYSSDYSKEVMETSEILSEGVQTVMYRTDDPVADHARWSADQEREAAKYPVCAYCGYFIQDDKLWDFDGVLYHDDCAREEFQKDTEDYIE